MQRVLNKEPSCLYGDLAFLIEKKGWRSNDQSQRVLCQ
jgi:hypothetical protein